MNSITHVMKRAVIAGRATSSLQCVKSGTSLFAQSSARKKLQNINSIQPIYVNLVRGVSSTPLRKKYIKGLKELTKAHGKSTIAKLTHSKNSDRAVQAQNELAQHTAAWYLKANKYAKQKRYDKEYQALYMLMCYFAQKQNVLSWKVRKAHEDGDYKLVLSLLSTFRPEEIPAESSDIYAQALFQTGKIEEALNFVNRRLEGAHRDEAEPPLGLTTWRQRLYFTKVQLLLAQGKNTEAIECESEMDHDTYLWPLARGLIANTVFPDDNNDEYEALEGYDMATLMLQKAHISFNRAQPDLYMAQYYERVGNIQEAINAYQYVLWIKPHERSAMERLIGLYSEAGLVDEAEIMKQRLENTKTGDAKFSALKQKRAKKNSKQ